MEMFMIVPPLNDWDKPADEIALRMGSSSIRPTAAAAWAVRTAGRSEKIQAWFDRGYRVRRVSVQLIAETEDPTLKQLAGE